MVTETVQVRAPSTIATPVDPASIESLYSRYAAAATLPDSELRQALVTFAEAEHRLPKGGLRAVTLARMQALLRLDRELGADAVQRLVSTLESVMDGLPGALAMRRVEFVQTLYHGFSAADQERLKRLMPGVLEVRPANRHGGSAPVRWPRRGWQFWKRV